MTIILTAVIPDGIIMAAESRSILTDCQIYGTGKQGLSDADFEILSDNEDKIYVLGNRFGLAYTGFCFDPLNGWRLEYEIPKLNDQALNGASINDLAHSIRESVSPICPPGHDFSFVLAGYGTELLVPIVVQYRQGQLLNPVGFTKNDVSNYGQVKCGLVMDGETSIVRKLFSDEKVGFADMNMTEAIEFAFLTITVGCEFLRFFEGYKPVSGGPIDILAIKETGINFVVHKSDFRKGVNYFE